MSLLTCLLASLCGLLPLAEDEGEILDQFEAALRLAAHRGELPATLDPTFKTLEGLDSAAVVDALADAYAAIEERAETTEAKRQKRLEVGARDRKEIDDLRRAQDRILRRMKLLKSGKARRRAYERALAEERGSWSLRMALAALCGPTKVELAPLRAALESSGQDLFIALEIARRLGKRAGPLIEPVVAALHRQQPALRMAAAEAVAALARPEGIEPLIEALDRTDGRDRRQLASALERLTRQPLGTTVSSWRKWWADHRDTAFAGELPLGGGEVKVGKSEGTGYYFGIPQDGRSILYVVDLSNSMKKKLSNSTETRDDRARIELKQAIAQLPEEHRFNVLMFGDRMRVFAPRQVAAKAATVRECHKWIDGQGLEFGTNTYGALEMGFALAGRGAKDRWYGAAIDTIFLLSDGQPTLPVQGRKAPADKPERVLSAVRRWNPLDRVKIHTITLGKGQRGSLMKKLANENGGEHVLYVGGEKRP